MGLLCKLLFRAAALTALIAMPLAANAVVIPVSPIPSSGSSNGLNWNITQSGNMYTYTYTMGVSANSATLGIGAFSSVGLTNANFANYVTMLSGSSSGAGQFDTHFFGVSFNPISVVGGQVQFLTSIAPIWGSDFINTTSPTNHFQNANYGVDTPVGTSNFTGWVPVIGNIATAAPEPGTWMLMGTGLMAILLLKLRKKFNAVETVKSL